MDLKILKKLIIKKKVSMEKSTLILILDDFIKNHGDLVKTYVEGMSHMATSQNLNPMNAKLQAIMDKSLWNLRPSDIIALRKAGYIEEANYKKKQLMLFFFIKWPASFAIFILGWAISTIIWLHIIYWVLDIPFFVDDVDPTTLDPTKTDSTTATNTTATNTTTTSTTNIKAGTISTTASGSTVGIKPSTGRSGV